LSWILGRAARGRYGIRDQIDGLWSSSELGIGNGLIGGANSASLLVLGVVRSSAFEATFTHNVIARGCRFAANRHFCKNETDAKNMMYLGNSRPPQHRGLEKCAQLAELLRTLSLFAAAVLQMSKRILKLCAWSHRMRLWHSPGSLRMDPNSVHCCIGLDLKGCPLADLRTKIQRSSSAITKDTRAWLWLRSHVLDDVPTFSFCVSGPHAECVLILAGGLRMVIQ
jgi:hypothetical protein